VVFYLHCLRRDYIRKIWLPHWNLDKRHSLTNNTDLPPNGENGNSGKETKPITAVSLTNNTDLPPSGENGNSGNESKLMTAV